MDDPREPHFTALKCILFYICGSTSYGLQLFSSPSCDIIAYSDADWAGYPVTHDLHSDIVSFGDTTCCLGHQNIRISFLGLVSKQNIEVLPMSLKKLFGFIICFLNFTTHHIRLPLFISTT